MQRNLVIVVDRAAGDDDVLAGAAIERGLAARAADDQVLAGRLDQPDARAIADEHVVAATALDLQDAGDPTGAGGDTREQVDVHTGRVFRIIQLIGPTPAGNRTGDALTIAEHEIVGAATAGQVGESREREQAIDVARVVAGDVKGVGCAAPMSVFVAVPPVTLAICVNIGTTGVDVLRLPALLPERTTVLATFGPINTLVPPPPERVPVNEPSVPTVNASAPVPPVRLAIPAKVNVFMVPLS